MKIVAVRQGVLSFGAERHNAGIGFQSMTGGVVAVISDHYRNGRPLIGLALDSIGRYANPGLLRERFIPRLLACSPENYAAAQGNFIDPRRAWQALMRDEKPGGHGGRAAAVGLLEAALWDLLAKAEQLPLNSLLAEQVANEPADQRVRVYASGGHYLTDRGADVLELRRTLRAGIDAGHRYFKIKYGGADIDHDNRRIDTALELIGDPTRLAVDLNASLGRGTWADCFAALEHYPLAWIEEPVDPLDFALLKELSARSETPLATGENLFSAVDCANLLRFGELRSERDWLQFDISLSYGISGYIAMLAEVERHGWSRRRLLPHAGHLFALQVAAGLRLGGHETALGGDFPVRGFGAGGVLSDGSLTLDDTPGVGFEAHPELMQLFSNLQLG